MWQKEGVDDSALAVEQEPDTVVSVCDNCCDHDAKTLEIPIDPTLPAKKGKKLMAYMVCQSDHWKDLCDPVSGFKGSSWKDFHEALPEEHAAELAVLDLHVNFQTKRGGKASVTSKKKKSVKSQTLSDERSTGSCATTTLTRSGWKTTIESWRRVRQTATQCGDTSGLRSSCCSSRVSRLPRGQYCTLSPRSRTQTSR